jgi:hypothetical protein
LNLLIHKRDHLWLLHHLINFKYYVRDYYDRGDHDRDCDHDHDHGRGCGGHDRDRDRGCVLRAIRLFM